MCCALIVLVLTAGFGFAAGGDEATTGGDDVTVIKWFGTRGTPGPKAPIPGMLEELIGQKVGFPIEFELYGAVDNHQQKLQLMLAANELPDLFHYFSIDEEFLSQAAAKFEVSEMLENMPQMSKFLIGLMDDLGLDQDATWARYQDTDGMMWGTPRIWDLGWIPSGQMWRKDILDDLGYAIPTTIAETEEVFAAYKAAYPKLYAMGGSGTLDWQCFDQVWNAFGITGGGHGIRNGKVQQHFVWPEFRQALVVLARWYQKGFIDPEYITHKNLDKFRIFAEGKYLTTEWLNRDNWDLTENSPHIGTLITNVPGAVAVPATHIAADKNTKPMQRVWNPFLLQVISFGSHLENNHDHMHKIMQVADLISQDKEVKFLAAYGVEGEHYVIDAGETAPRLADSLRGTAGADLTDRFGFGFYWDGTFSTYTPLLARTQNSINKYVTDPNGIYGKNNLDYWLGGSIITGAVKDENGEDIGTMMNADSNLSWIVTAVKIISGKEPIEYYDEWLEYYYKNGGTEWERNATRLYLK